MDSFNTEKQMKTYIRSECIVFLKTKEEYGGLSNMSSGFPICINGINILTSEALYQACRFPHRSDVQKIIIDEKSPITAKMKGKPYCNDSRPDWDKKKVNIMRWCLRVKLFQNWNQFSSLLLETGNKSIVEESKKDEYWGAKPIDSQTLHGMNILGRLLMELRNIIIQQKEYNNFCLAPLKINNFLLYNQQIETIYPQFNKNGDLL